MTKLIPGLGPPQAVYLVMRRGWALGTFSDEQMAYHCCACRYTGCEYVRKLIVPPPEATDKEQDKED